MECLKEIVGVTTEDKICITGGLSSAEIAKLKKSTSGLYLQDLPGGITLKALRNVDATRNLADMSLGAIGNAIKRTEDDLRVAISTKYKGSKNSYIGNIGRMSYAQSLGVSERYQALRIRPTMASDAVVTVTRLNIIINETASFDLMVYKAICDTAVPELVTSYSVNATSNQYFTIIPPSPLSLPLMENGREVEYWFVWDRVAANNAQPKDTKIECSSCEASTKSTLYEFVTLQGVELADINNITNKKTDSYSHGIILDVELRCETERLICREYNEEEAISVALSYAVWYKAGELLIEDVMKQPDINRYTTMDREYLWGKRNHFRKEYEIRINYIAATIDVSQSNCYICRESANQPFFAGILS